MNNHSATNNKQSEALLAFYKHYVLFIGKSLDTTIHAHHLMQVVIGLDNETCIEIDGTEHHSRFALVDADVQHLFDGRAGLHAILLVDSSSADAILCRQLLAGRKYLLNDDLIPPGICRDLSSIYEEQFSGNRLQAVIDLIMRGLTGQAQGPVPGNGRFKEVLRFLENSDSSVVSVKALAKTAGLSESRFIHLFTQEVGIPVRRYFLWCKLLRAVKTIVGGADFTEAAYSAGFSDSAHLSRTFRKMFGLSLLELFRNYQNSRFVQVFVFDSLYI